MTLESHYKSIQQFDLLQPVPDVIKTQFDTARNIYVYAWYQYHFFNVAEAHALSVLEFSIKERIGKADINEYKKKMPKRNLGLKLLIKLCSENGLIRNEGFSAWYRHPLKTSRLSAKDSSPMQPLNERYDTHCTNCMFSMPLHLYYKRIVEKKDWRWKPENLSEHKPCPVCHGKVQVIEYLVSTFEEEGDYVLKQFSFFEHAISLSKEVINGHQKSDIYSMLWEEVDDHSINETLTLPVFSKLADELIAMANLDTIDINGYVTRLDEIAHSLLQLNKASHLRPYLINAASNCSEIRLKLGKHIREERNTMRDAIGKASDNRRLRYSEQVKAKLELKLPFHLQRLQEIIANRPINLDLAEENLDNAIKDIEELGILHRYDSQIENAQFALNKYLDDDIKAIETVHVEKPKPLSPGEISFREQQSDEVKLSLKLMERLKQNPDIDIDTFERHLDEIVDVFESAGLIQRYEPDLILVSDHLTNKLIKAVKDHI